MTLRDLAESQLACKREADAAEFRARQSAYAAESVRLCTEWFLGTLKTEPTSVECIEEFRAFKPHHLCRVEADGLTFEWADDATVFGERYHAKDPLPPGVAVVEEHTHKDGSTFWRKVVGTYSYTGHLWATDLPSLALHLQAVDTVLARRK